MARKSRYLGYMKRLQKISKHEKTSTKESLLDKLRSMKNREFTMNIPVGEGAEDEHLRNSSETGILCRRGETGTGEKRNAPAESGGYPYGGNAASFQ